MDWKTIKLISLHKMFLVTGNEIVEDETTQEYLNKMWGAANEAMVRLATISKVIMKKAEIDLDDESIIKVGDKAYISLNTLFPDIFNVDYTSVYLDNEKFMEFDLIGNDMIINATSGTLTFIYNAFPVMFTPETPDDEEIPLEYDACVLIPLYIASQLYKDDDNSLATQYRNEFETGLETLSPRLQTRKVRFVEYG